MKRRWNLFVWAGFGLTALAFLSYFAFFARFPVTRDFPWVNLILFLAGGWLLGIGLQRAFREPEQLSRQSKRRRFRRAQPPGIWFLSFLQLLSRQAASFLERRSACRPEGARLYAARPPLRRPERCRA